MKRTDVLSIEGFHPATAKAIVTYLRCNSRQPFTGDATLLIRNEGMMQGIHEAADMVEKLLKPERPETPPQPKQMYPDPSQTSNR